MVPPGTTDGPSWDQLEKSTENKRLFRQNNPFFGGPSWDHCSVIHTLKFDDDDDDDAQKVSSNGEGEEACGWDKELRSIKKSSSLSSCCPMLL